MPFLLGVYTGFAIIVFIVALFFQILGNEKNFLINSIAYAAFWPIVFIVMIAQHFRK